MHRTMIATSTILLALATHAAAQDWPTRPMTLVVPFSAGGGVDVSARIQAQRMGELLGQTIIVENVGAAAGMAGGQRVAKAAPDGYTFLIGNTGTHAFNQSLYKKPLYNAATDFQPVGLVSESPRILIARKDLPVNNLKEFIAYIKANESKMQFGSAGVGSGTHLPCVLFNLAIGANVTHVPYRGEGPVMQDLIGGRIDYMCATIQSGAAQSKEGTVKGDRRDVGEAGADHPRSCHDRRAGPARRRGERMERFLPAEGHAGSDRAQAQQGDERYDRRSHHPQAAGRARPRNRAARAPLAGISRQISAAGNRALGQADPGGRHQRGLTNPDHPRAQLAIRSRRRLLRRGRTMGAACARTTGEGQSASVKRRTKRPNPAGGKLGEDNRRGGYRLFSYRLPARRQAENWPTRAITMVVPYAAGGPVDTIGRILAARLSEILGQQVVIENAGGAGGMTGAARVAKSAPDGYTVLLSGSAVLAINQTLYKKPLYNAVTDFEHVVLFSDSARVLITRKDLPANTLPEFVAYAKANQGKMQYGSAGVGAGIACVRRPARRRHGHQDHSCALSRRRAGDAGFDRGPHRLHCRTDLDGAARRSKATR